MTFTPNNLIKREVLKTLEHYFSFFIMNTVKECQLPGAGGTVVSPIEVCCEVERNGEGKELGRERLKSTTR